MAIFLLTSVFDSSLKSDCHMHSQVSCISNFHITLQLITSHDSINVSSLYLQSLHCSLLGRNQLIFLIPCQSLMILCLWVLACFFISTTFAFVLSWILVCLLNSLCSDGLKLPFITWHLNLTMPSCFVSMWPNNSLNGFHFIVTIFQLTSVFDSSLMSDFHVHFHVSHISNFDITSHLITCCDFFVS